MVKQQLIVFKKQACLIFFRRARKARLLPRLFGGDGGGSRISHDINAFEGEYSLIPSTPRI